MGTTLASIKYPDTNGKLQDLLEREIGSSSSGSTQAYRLQGSINRSLREIYLKKINSVGEKLQSIDGKYKDLAGLEQIKFSDKLLASVVYRNLVIHKKRAETRFRNKISERRFRK